MLRSADGTPTNESIKHNKRSIETFRRNPTNRQLTNALICWIDCNFERMWIWQAKRLCHNIIRPHADCQPTTYTYLYQLHLSLSSSSSQEEEDTHRNSFFYPLIFSLMPSPSPLPCWFTLSHKAKTFSCARHLVHSTLFRFPFNRHATLMLLFNMKHFNFLIETDIHALHFARHQQWHKQCKNTLAVNVVCCQVKIFSIALIHIHNNAAISNRNLDASNNNHSSSISNYIHRCWYYGRNYFAISTASPWNESKRFYTVI